MNSHEILLNSYSSLRYNPIKTPDARILLTSKELVGHMVVPLVALVGWPSGWSVTISSVEAMYCHITQRMRYYPLVN